MTEPSKPIELNKEAESNGILNKFRKAYRWYKQHNPSSDTESDDESGDEVVGDADKKRSSTADPQTETIKDQEHSTKPVIKSASTETEFKKRFSMTKSDYLKVPTSERFLSASPTDQSLLDPDAMKPKYTPIIYRRRSSVALTK